MPEQKHLSDVDHQILIIGGDHSNTLGVIRALGRANANFSVLIHTFETSKNKILCCHSRYIHNNFDIISNDETAILNYLLNYRVELTDILVIPTSDAAAFIIDKHYNILSERYLLPGINNTEGEVCRLMNKYEQKLLADKYQIPMAKTWVIDLDDKKLPHDLTYPCICKPMVSAFGNKSDISRISSEDEIYPSFKNFQEKGYKEVLIQEFLNMDYEIVAFGCRTITSNEIIYESLRKIMRYPVVGGSLSFAVSVCDNKEKEKIFGIISILNNLNYNGLFDIEMFNIGGKYYLNEINFRNSGNACVLTQNGVNISEIWAVDKLKYNISHYQTELKKEIKYLVFIGQLSLFIHRGITLVEFIESILKANTFVQFDPHDLRGSSVYWIEFLKSVIKKVLSVMGVVSNR